MFRSRRSSRRLTPPLGCRRFWPRSARDWRRSSCRMADRPTARRVSPARPARLSSARRGAGAVSLQPGPLRPPGIGCCSCTPIAVRRRRGKRSFALSSPRRRQPVGPAISNSRWMTRARRRDGWNAPFAGAAACWRCPYGDQGLLISRRLYDEVGGFAAIPLMEDVDLVRRLGSCRLAPIPVPLYSSARRYRDEGYIRRPLRNLFCLSLYFAGVPPRRLLQLYG